MIGQASYEFLVYVCILVLIMAVFFWHSASLQRQSMYTKIDTEAKNLCDSIAFEINSAVRSGDGYNRKFLVPKNFAGITDFDITVIDYAVFIEWGDKSVVSNIVVRDINGTVERGRWNMIKNINGEINATQV